jgi:outer membrane protein OmpA-like peptidoglycan-associated protein
MTRLALAVLIAALFAATPAWAQVVGNCPSDAGAAATSQPSWILFDLGSAQLRPEAKPTIAKAVATAKARQVNKLCVVGQTDKLGDKNYNAKLAMARAEAVAAEVIRQGFPAKNVVIAANPEAFSNLSFGSYDASEKDRRVTIIYR